MVAKDETSAEVKSKVQDLGLSTPNAQRVEDGYLVEDDILLSDADLNSKPNYKMLRVGEEEQYRTNNLVSGGSGRTIGIAISTSLPSTHVAAVAEAIRRYNAEGLLPFANCLDGSQHLGLAIAAFKIYGWASGVVGAIKQHRLYECGGGQNAPQLLSVCLLHQ